jgi:hypothetical protein
MKRQIKGLELAGIIIVYVAASSIFLAIILSWASWGWLETYEIILLIISLLAIIITIFYHTGSIKSKVLVGITGILVSVIGGILILVSKNEDDLIENSNPPKENKISGNDPIERLLRLKKLFDEGIIDKATFEIKKEDISHEL